MVGQKLELLECNLNKKSVLLKEMTEVLDEQLRLLGMSDIQLEELDICMEKQDNLTQELEVLNEEADSLYKYFQKCDISFEVSNTAKLACIQKLLSQITTSFNNLQKKEQSARQQMEAFLQKERKNFGDGRRSSKAALDYYKSMSGSAVVPPQFMDQKK